MNFLGENSSIVFLLEVGLKFLILFISCVVFCRPNRQICEDVLCTLTKVIFEVIQI